MEAHTPLHMSPAQAAQVAGVSRWTIMRAIKSNDLMAIRDNRNQWKITQNALDNWRGHSVRTPEKLHQIPANEFGSDLQKQLREHIARADLAEALLARERDANADLKADRDYWRQQATVLLENKRLPRWRWWNRR